MRFFDRNEAGSLLADKLNEKNISNPLIVAIPRGGIPVAIPIANKLNAELKLSMTRKIGYPGYEEFAIGAVSLKRLLLMELAITDIKEMHPKKITICTPVCSIQAHDKLEEKVDKIISLIKPMSFSGVGSYYDHFDQLTDNEIVGLLRKSSNSWQKTES